MGLAFSDTPATEGFAPQIVRIIFHNSSAAPGEGFKVDLHWQNLGDEPSLEDYWIFVHFRPENSLDEPYEPGGFSWDFPPARNTSRWQTGFVVKEESCYFRVPPGTSPGRYAVLIGLYDREGSLKRIPLLNKSRDVGNARYRVGYVNVVEESGQPSKVLAYRLIWRVKEPRPAPEVRDAKFVTKGRISVGFDPTRPAIRGWKVNGADIPLGGDPAIQGPEAEFVSLEDNRRRTSLALDADWHFNCRISGDIAVYKCRLRYKADEVARFDVRFQLTRTGLSLKLGPIQESPDYHLLNVTFPSVVSIPVTAPGAALVIPSSGGRLVNIQDSGRHRQAHLLDISEPIPAGIVVCNEALATGWVKSADDILVSEVMEAECKQGTLGVIFTNRIRATKPELQFKPKKNGEFEVNILSANPDETLTWADGASLISKHFRARPNNLYIDSIVYKILLAEPDSSDVTTFDEALEIIKRVHHLTAGSPQVVYLAGWQHNGVNTGFPDTSTVNRQLGGAKALTKLISEAEKLDAVISLIDNFDEAYQDSHAWDESLIARDGSGEMIKTRKHPGREAFIISPCVYSSSGKAEKRVEKTFDTYTPSKTIHLDVMSGSVIRYDHNPEVSAGADASLTAHKSILDLWRKRGIDVSSDGLTAPFVGPITYFWNAPKDQEAGPYSHEIPIPFVPVVLHGKVIWGGSIDLKYGETLTLLYGGTFSEEWTKHTTDQHICDRYYLITLPWSRLADRAVTGYQRKGNRQKMIFQEGDFIEADVEAGSYTIMCSNYVVARNNVTTCPVDRNRILAYSTRPGRLVIDFPPGWGKQEKLRVEVLDSTGGQVPLEYRLLGKHIEIDMPERRPVVISKK